MKKHIIHHATKYHEAEKRLKKLITGYNPVKEKIFPVFFATFILVLVSLLIFRNWGNILRLISTMDTNPPVTEEPVEAKGFKTGVLGVYKIDAQANRVDRNQLASIATEGSMRGVEINMAFGQGRGQEPARMGNMLKDSVWVTNYLSTGQHLTKLQQENAKNLQKSILTTYYLGEKTIDINSTLQTDSKILSQIKNALSVNLFQYLNQSVNRSDALDEYLNLLNAMLDKTNQHVTDLQYKVDFLSANFQSKEEELKISEQAFFDNLKIFEGPNAEGELGRFVGLQQSQSEIRAKLGAYKTLKDYYLFFKPRLENMIAAIKANRDPLIAGVKVVEIQNMTLPLIIKQK